MSAEVMRMLSERWQCSLQEVRERITARLQVAGILPDDAAIKAYEGEPFARKLVLGVTDDNRVAVLGPRDEVVLWLDDDPPVTH